jgi:hypothetical protein
MKKNLSGETAPYRALLVVAGWSLKNAQPRVWDDTSPFYLPKLQAIMLSYAEFHQMKARRRKAMDQGLREYLGIPAHVKIYLDNGAFSFMTKTGSVPEHDYIEFVERAEPDWYPIPQDFIPSPKMSKKDQQECFEKTMSINRSYRHDGYVPIVHISECLGEYLDMLSPDDRQILQSKTALALGGIVPNLLRRHKAIPYKTILQAIQGVHQTFHNKAFHIFGIGGTSTLHLAALLGTDSVDSSGWRNRAARGIVQLPGRGDRGIVQLGSWKVRAPSAEEMKELEQCQCPACQAYGLEGLQANKVFGSNCRATHNLWVLLEEAQKIEEHLNAGNYAEWYQQYLTNSIYRPLVDQLVSTLPLAPTSPGEAD